MHRASLFENIRQRDFYPSADIRQVRGAVHRVDRAGIQYRMARALCDLPPLDRPGRIEPEPHAYHAFNSPLPRHPGIIFALFYRRLNKLPLFRGNECRSAPADLTDGGVNGIRSPISLEVMYFFNSLILLLQKSIIFMLH